MQLSKGVGLNTNLLTSLRHNQFFISLVKIHFVIKKADALIFNKCQLTKLVE